MRKLILIMLLAVLSSSAMAVNFFYSSRFSSGEFAGNAMEMTISGKIEKGDTEKFLSFLRENPRDAIFGIDRVVLDSQGGDVIEAMKLSQALKEHYPDTMVRGDCTSACLLLWLAGGVHYLPVDGNKIGIHRPYFDPNEFSQLPIREAESQYKKLDERFKEYLLNQGLPQSIYEKLLSTSSNKIYWLTIEDLILIGISSPAYEERFISKCGNVQDSVAKKKCRWDMVSPERIKAWQKVMGQNVYDDTKAKWHAFGHNNSLTAYVDSTSTISNGDKVKMWILIDYKSPSTKWGDTFLSEIDQNEFDCKEYRSRGVYAIRYSGNMARGRKVKSGASSENWDTPPAGSLFEKAWKIACKKD
jgi:hypothetical protein